MLFNVVNFVTGSSKHLLELQTTHDIEVGNSVASGERETGKGLNQIVATTKELLQSLRDEGFDVLLDYVMSVCAKYKIDVPDMNARYVDNFRSVRQINGISVEHHYHYDVFIYAINFQLEELHYRFNDNTVQLLRLSSSLEPQNNFELFDMGNICTLATIFYPADFEQQEMYHLKLQLEHYKIDVVNHARLICLVLTLLVSTTTTERAFSAMKIVKTVLRNKMEEEYLRDGMLINIEREYAEDIDPYELIDEFYAQKIRRVQLK
ncbi:hypothetical protein AgCh_003451 [Apium graveolens]